MGGPIAHEGDVAWVDLITGSPERSARFYGELFGWRIASPGPASGGYRVARLAGRAVAGILPAQPEQPLEEWAVWLAVDDVDAAYERALRLGASELIEPSDVREHGRSALILDPAGVCTGLWRGGRLPGLEARGVAGSPAWFELHVGDADAAREFYREAFGLTAVRMGAGGEFRYWTLHHGEAREAVFGLFDSGEREPGGASTGAWVVYFATDDADVCVRRATSLGAELRFGPEPSVYGRMATLCDPSGAAFNLLQPEQSVRAAARSEPSEPVPARSEPAPASAAAEPRGEEPPEPAAAASPAEPRQEALEAPEPAERAGTDPVDPAEPAAAAEASCERAEPEHIGAEQVEAEPEHVSSDPVTGAP